ncbi:hypothetical protein TNCV_2969681 [Trichonephila clavipes]|nr:hypothetical protein TNCV_2969681 [Trichonephila clavipes]
MGREDVPQSTKRSNEAERRRGEGKNVGILPDMQVSSVTKNNSSPNEPSCTTVTMSFNGVLLVVTGTWRSPYEAERRRGGEERRKENGTAEGCESRR